MRDTDMPTFPECGRRVGIGRTIGSDVSGRGGEDDRQDAREEAGQDVGERRVGSGELDHRARGQQDARPDDPIDTEQDDAQKPSLLIDTVVTLGSVGPVRSLGELDVPVAR